MFRNISVIGLGKLGYPMAQFLSSSGAKINCYDKNNLLVNELKINCGEHLYETGLKNLVNNKMIWFIIKAFLIVFSTRKLFILLFYPFKLDGSFSNEVIIEILDEIADVILKTKRSYIININSTVQPGSIEGVNSVFRKQRFKK